jgi:hypothetical protein
MQEMGKKQRENSVHRLIHACFLLGLFFSSENGGDIFRRKLVDYAQMIEFFIPTAVRTTNPTR